MPVEPNVGGGRRKDRMQVGKEDGADVGVGSSRARCLRIASMSVRRDV